MRPSARTVRKASQRRVDTAHALRDDFQKNQVRLAEHRKVPSLPLASFAGLSPVPLALLTRGGVIISADASLFPLLQAAPSQVLHKPLAEFLPARDLPAFFKFLASCAQTGETRRAEFSLAVPGQSPRDILLIIAPLESPQPGAAFRAAFVDLSEIEPRDLGPRAPRQNARLIEVIDGIVWEADYPKHFTFVSAQAERILGFPAADWVRDPDFWEKHIYHEDRDRVAHARADAARKPASHVLEYRMVTAARKTIWVKDSAVIVGAAPGWTRMCGIITDITDLQRAREGLKRANQDLEAAIAERTSKMQQSLDAMETLCYGIAHDFKAPVRAVEGFLALLTSEHEHAFDDDAKLYVQRCRAALGRMGELIEAVLTYGRLNHSAPELIPIRTRALIERVIKTIEPDLAALGGSIQVQAAMPAVLGNPYLLEQVFTNLIANALKFTAPGVPPEITISAAEIETPQLGVPPSGGQAVTPSIRITVTDNGIGISPQAVKRLFGMFQRLHPASQYPGTGIGLAVVKRAVELMNGRLGVFSEPSHGSSFWFELPSASRDA